MKVMANQIHMKTVILGIQNFSFGILFDCCYMREKLNLSPKKKSSLLKQSLYCNNYYCNNNFILLNTKFLKKTS